MKISAHEAALGFHQEQDQVVRRRLTDEHQLDVFIVRDALSNLIALEIRLLPADLGLPVVDVGDIIDIEFLVDNGTLRIKLLSKDYSDIFYVLARREVAVGDERVAAAGTVSTLPRAAANS